MREHTQAVARSQAHLRRQDAVEPLSASDDPVPRIPRQESACYSGMLVYCACVHACVCVGVHEPVACRVDVDRLAVDGARIASVCADAGCVVLAAGSERKEERRTKRCCCITDQDITH